MNESAPALHPLRAGLLAARANLIPGLLVQGLMVGVVLAFYFLPAARPAFDQIGAWKKEGGFLFSFIAAVIAGGILPEILRIFVFQKGRPERKNLANLAFALPFWGLQGVTVDLFYRGQALWFGNDAHWLTVLQKVCVDQFLYNPIYAAPMGVAIYEWKNRGYCWSREFVTARWYRNRVIPALLATWTVWVPVVSVVYCLPQILQIPLFNLALTFWVMMFTWMNEALVTRPAPNAP